MLRKRLLILFGCVVTLLLVVGLGVVLLLQNVVVQLNHVNSDAMSAVSAVTAAQVSVGGIRGEMERMKESGQTLDIDQWGTAMRDLKVNVLELNSLAGLGPVAGRERAELPGLTEELAKAGDALLSADEAKRSAIRVEAVATLDGMRDRLDHIQAALRTHTQSELRAAIGGLRSLALGLGLGFVIVLNVSIVFLSRVAGMILKPIDKLVDASRRLAREEFHHRVELDGRDEFSELARAYNGLAEQLQANEQRKIETLYQVARTLNHELNNAIAIIQLQLALASRSPTGGGIEAGRLREIQQALSRMTGTVSALTRVRRIVLTDYLSGVKMLDLEASVAEAPTAGGQPLAAETAIRAYPT